MTIFKKSVGVDISDRTIEVVELSSSGSNVKIQSLGRSILPSGVVGRGRILKAEQLANILKQVLNEAKPTPIKPRNIVFGLPESRVYTRVFELSPHEKEKRYELILEEARGSIPLKEKDLLFTYSVLSENEGKAEILLVGISKEVFQEWETFFKALNITVRLFDIETLANIRGIFPEGPNTPTAVVDFGTLMSTIAIVDSGGLRYVYSTETGGESLTKAVAKDTGIILEKAETEKVEKGLLEKDTKLASVLLVPLKLLVSDIKSSIKYCKENSGKEVKEIVLTGGSSKLKGLLEYLKNETQLPVRLGESFLLKKEANLEFVEAIGLALRGFKRPQSSKDPAIKLRKPMSKLGSPIKKPQENATETDTYELVNPTGIAEFKKLNLQINLLLGIILLGIFVFLFAYRFRDAQRSSRQLALLTIFQKEGHVYTFKAEASLETDFKKYAENKVQGRFIENDVPSSKDDDTSRELAEKTLVEGEILWETPIQKITSESGEKITFRWLSYFENDANRLLVSSIGEIENDYIINSIKRMSLVETDTPGLFKLAGEVIVTLKTPLDSNTLTLLRESNAEQSEEDRSKEASFVEILETPTGWLNVREGPGLEFDVTSRLNNGEEYLLIGEEKDWFNIQIDDDSSGWVFSEYAKLKN